MLPFILLQFPVSSKYGHGIAGCRLVRLGGRAMTTARCLDVWAMPGYSMVLERGMTGHRALYDRVYVYA